MQRIIMHIDLDKFYAAVEENRNPSIIGKAVVICVYSGRTEDSGAVSTANYKARDIGIKAGIPIRLAKNLAEKSGQETVFLPVDMEYYREISERVMDIIENHSDIMEQTSIDEAYVEVTKRSGGNFEKAEEIAMEIRKSIKDRENLTCSIGISENKLVAKIASDYRKPEGLTTVRPDMVQNFLFPLPLSKIHGIGPKSIELLESINIQRTEELAKSNVNKLIPLFGKNKSQSLIEKANGIDDSPVEERIAKQVSRIVTLKADTNAIEDLMPVIEYLCKEMENKIGKKGAKFKTVSIITIDSSMEMQTRSRSLDNHTSSTDTLKDISVELVKEFIKENSGKNLRRFGLRVSSLEYGEPEKKQKSLFEFK